MQKREPSGRVLRCSKPSFGICLVVSVGYNNITVWSLTWLAAAFITECLDGTNSSTDGHEVTPLCRCWQGGNMYRVGTHTHTYIHTITTHYYRTITKHKVLISEIFIFGNIINETVIGLPILWCIFPLILFIKFEFLYKSGFILSHQSGWLPIAGMQYCFSHVALQAHQIQASLRSWFDWQKMSLCF